MLPSDEALPRRGLSSKRRSLVDLGLKQMKFDATVMSSDGKQLTCVTFAITWTAQLTQGSSRIAEHGPGGCGEVS